MSLVGSGKYDAALAAARQVSGAMTSVFVVLDGERGRGFSVYGLKSGLKRLPELLRQVADDIESSHSRQGEAMDECSERLLYGKKEQEKFVVYPTHSCFDDAMEYCDKAVGELPELLDKLIVVHGIVLQPNGPRKDRPFTHAWVEHADMCWNGGILNHEKTWYGVDRGEFYLTMRVREFAAYTLRTAYRLQKQHGSTGPWE